jgi:hypothetical protein
VTKRGQYGLRAVSTDYELSVWTDNCPYDESHGSGLIQRERESWTMTANCGEFAQGSMVLVARV